MREKNLICILILLALFPVITYSAKDNKSDDLEPALQNAFQAIYFSTYGLDYPGDDEGVAHCIAYKDKDCLKTFNNKNVVCPLLLRIFFSGD
jgi:hypothetical protein